MKTIDSEYTVRLIEISRMTGSCMSATFLGRVLLFKWDDSLLLLTALDGFDIISIMSKHNKLGDRGRSKQKISTYQVGGQHREALEKLDEKSTIFQNFRKYSQELDKKHDKFERIVKLSRDITIESKRIIFLLHSINRDSKRSSVLTEAESRLGNLITYQWRLVAKELHNEDPYLYHRAFSPGMQEFMEASLFFYYLKDDKLPHWDYYQNKLKYNEIKESDTDGAIHSKTDTSVTLIPLDFILGLADVTGELMRKCINNLGDGDVEGCFKLCNFVRSLYSGYLKIGLNGGREMFHKMFTLRQSLLKMEMVCYNIQVRGSEIPKYMLADIEDCLRFDNTQTYLSPAET